MPPTCDRAANGSSGHRGLRPRRWSVGPARFVAACPWLPAVPRRSAAARPDRAELGLARTWRRRRRRGGRLRRRTPRSRGRRAPASSEPLPCRAELALRRARSSASGSAARAPASDDRLDVAGDHRQTAIVAGGRVQRLRRQLAPQRARPGEPLDGRRSAANVAPRSRARATSTGSHVAGIDLRVGARVADAAHELQDRVDLGLRPLRPASPSAGQRAWISSAGSVARCGSAPQIASVTNGINGCSRRRYVSSTRRAPTTWPRVGLRQARVGEADLGELDDPNRSTRSRSRRTGGARPRRTRSRPWPRRRSATVGAKRATGSSARPGRGAPASGSPRSASGGDVRGRAPSTNRAAFQSLLAKLRASSSRRAASRRSLPGAVPLTSAKRSASAPISSIVLERVDDVALRLGHLLAVRVAHEAGQVDDVEGRLSGEPLAEHHHPGDPEEDDVVAGLHHGARVVARAGRACRPASRASRTATDPLENQVSKMSGSCVSSATRRRRPRTRRAVGVGATPSRGRPGNTRPGSDGPTTAAG